ncbi:hypothetical protein THAOC_06266 [Thalassiosira oceanica]|uniref:Uncharacterized protein n=1 Tax=Thalassiosira oceanica TaxID=159749 RepID=K0TLX0_THAOC|nr:hypothetical protein THAOC_06266 [Thalassiosira oceanica]|eukprot:EJK72217.1 hypothetical protein THAOC_06266 [Thalassiosira oceanica]
MGSIADAPYPTFHTSGTCQPTHHRDFRSSDGRRQVEPVIGHEQPYRATDQWQGYSSASPCKDASKEQVYPVEVSLAALEPFLASHLQSGFSSGRLFTFVHNCGSSSGVTSTDINMMMIAAPVCTLYILARESFRGSHKKQEVKFNQICVAVRLVRLHLCRSRGQALGIVRLTSRSCLCGPSASQHASSAGELSSRPSSYLDLSTPAQSVTRVFREESQGRAGGGHSASKPEAHRCF